MDKEVLEFVIYLIHACSQRWGQSPAVVYKRLQAKDCISKYLIAYYDILHTQGTQAIVDDIEKYLEVRGDCS